MSYYTYILASQRNGTLYTGDTGDLARRVIEHKEHLKPGFTSKYGVIKLVWYEEFQDIRNATDLEKKIKKWRRAWKLQLIDSFNHDWKDLSIPDYCID
jgi:putative endonuclease